MKRTALIVVIAALAAGCSSAPVDENAGSTSSSAATATTAGSADGTITTDGDEPEATQVEADEPVSSTTVPTSATTTETIPQTTIDIGAPETTGPPITDPPPRDDEDDAVPPVETQAYTDDIAVACATVEFVYLGLRDGFDVDLLDLDVGAAMAEGADPARYGDVSAALIDAGPGDAEARADDFLAVCASQGYERL